MNGTTRRQSAQRLDGLELVSLARDEGREEVPTGAEILKLVREGLWESRSSAASRFSCRLAHDKTCPKFEERETLWTR
ncbi:MAG TPA: hypothetical protein VFF73_28035 [Planctomycetota bacterium]|nr:hypothetical protein [Planctomycetota bacterium]